MQSKLVTSTARLAAVEKALLDRQNSTDSTNSSKLDNPFREEGQLSKFASDIVDAVKSGRLDQIKPEEAEQVNNNNHTKKAERRNEEEPNQEPEQNPEEKIVPDPNQEGEAVLMSSCVEVEVGIVVSPKVSQTQTIVLPKSKMSRKCSCCVLL